MGPESAAAVPAVQSPLREQVRREREKVRALHEGGAQGGQVASALTDLYDRVIAAAWRAAVERVPAAERPRLLRDLAVVAVGGYGRADCAPYSDIDLLFLHPRRLHPAIQEVVNGLVRELWDIGLKLSQSVRSPAECVAFAARDLPHRTALTEARLLTGSPALFHELQRRVHRLHVSSSLGRFIDAVLEERRKEHQDYFSTVYLLEPNVKKSPGGLRDVHLLRWIALPRYGTRDPEMLRVGGVLAPEDAQTLGTASEFLARVRNELHFRAGSAQDVLTRDEQLRISKWLGFETQGALLGVERFMQQYYRHTTALHDLVLRFAHGARRGSGLRALLNRVTTRRVDEHYLLDRESVSLDPAASEEALRRADVLLDLFDLARRHGVPVRHESLERVRKAAPACEVTPRARARFLEIMGNPAGLGLLVRDLHRIGLLGRFVPAFERARCLMQFNQYHKYTVDEHSIRALEAAVARLADDGPVGQAYRETKRKDVLHLAVLLHDIGKGFEEDHSEVGRRIAEELAALLGLAGHERGQLVFLVHKHLAMAHVSQRRDISDLATLVQFVREVGTVDTLRMLLVLTAADTEAVAPGSLTSWKESLLVELYSRSMEELTGTAPVADERARAESIRAELEAKNRAAFPADWLRGQLAAMPPSYLRTTPPETVAAHLRALRTFDPKGVRVESQYAPEHGLTDYTVIVRDDLAPGIFSRISGALAVERLGIVSAQIVTRSDGLVLDTFRVVDGDFKGEPPPARRQDVARRIENVLLGRQQVEALFASRVAPSAPREHHASSGGPPQVHLDNATSDRFTIVELFADDRLGLLYEVTHVLFEMGLSIASAKISTRLDQVVDVFYVTEAKGGGKLSDEARVEEARRRLLEVVRRS
jgi:[protein-PII] uridylyltransferase